MRNMFTILKKELTRVMTDYRLIVMIFILPGVAIFMMYSLMGSLLISQVEDAQSQTIVIYEENMPETLKQSLLSLNGDETRIEFYDQSLSHDQIIDMIQDGDLSIAYTFQANFETAIETYEQGTPPPNMNVYYDYSRQHASYAHNVVSQMVESYRNNLLLERLADPSYHTIFTSDYVDDIVDERTVSGQGVAALMPMLIIIFLFAGAMSIGPDAIAGEKERGTIATLLITPTKRSEIALGKVISLSLLSFASALSSFIGVLLSLPRLMAMDDSMDINIYTVQDYALILIILISTVMIITGLITVISAFAKTIKEASMFIMPFYFITIFIGIISSFGAEPAQDALSHVIPIYGAVNLLSAIFTFNYSLINVFIVIISSVIYTALFTIVLTKMFDSEKIMFQK